MQSQIYCVSRSEIAGRGDDADRQGHSAAKGRCHRACVRVRVSSLHVPRLRGVGAIPMILGKGSGAASTVHILSID